jgi:rSAM/selenodomain-associated transferase 1
MKPAIALFARAPIPGQVKTRLIGRFSAQQVADLYGAFVLDMWEMLAAFAAQAELFLYTDREDARWRELAGAQTRLQQGADLGERMLDCFGRMRAAGCAPLMILGSDSPALPAATIAPWTELVLQRGAVLGPAADGGYYAIGCRESHPRMFEGVEWSGPRTLAQTTAALERCGPPPAYLPAYYDIDTPEDLARLEGEPDFGRQTGRYTRRWLEENHQHPGPTL